MALPTWEEVLTRSRLQPFGAVASNPEEAKKAFDWLMEKSYAVEKWKKLSKKLALRNITALIGMNLNQNNGKFVPGPGPGPLPDPALTYEGLNKTNPNFKEGFKNFLENPPKQITRSPALIRIANSNKSLKEKWDSLSNAERKSARTAIKTFSARQGKLTLDAFAPLTNFTRGTIGDYYQWSKRDFPELTLENSTRYNKTARAKEFFNFLKKEGIEVFQKGAAGTVYFTDVRNDPAKLKALDDFLNEAKPLSKLQRKQVITQSRGHSLYADTSQNLKSVLRAAQKNLNDTFKEYNDKGLKKFLKQNPRILKNATMWFRSNTATIEYTPWQDLYKKGFNMDKLRKSLKFELEHNRGVEDYWKKFSKEGRVLAKYQAINDVEFAHNLTTTTQRYNRGAKKAITKWIERNPTELKKITALETELADLGHRFYAGGEWRGRGLDFKSGYKDTIMDAWKKSFERGTGLKWKEQLKNIPEQTWTRAMKEVEHSPAALKQLGTFLGCPRALGAEGGRIGLQAGGQGLTACISTKLKQPGAIEKIAALPEEVGGALGKLKNTARGFLSLLGRGGVKAAPLAALAAVGAGIEPLVKQFRNDDPNTYLTDESQMKGMLLATIEGETPKVDEEILKWQYPGLGAATAAGAIPGARTVYEARRSGVPLDRSIGPLKGVGKTRAALGLSGVLGKALGASFSPLAVAATLPLTVAAQRKGGTEWGDIATDPMNWMAPAFASTGAEMATRGIKNPMLLKALRLGVSPKALSIVSRRFGLPGLAVSAGLWGYDKWKNRSINDE